MAGVSATRFDGWARFPARLALAVLAAFLILAALIPVTHVGGAVGPAAIPAGTETAAAAPRPRDHDLALYDRTIERLRAGESYYAFIAEEQRRARFPLRPALAVRLPTLAVLLAWLGETGTLIAAFALLAAVPAAWWVRLGDDPVGRARRALAIALLAFGCALMTARYFHTLHELWAGMLLALSLGLHRPGRWAASLAVAALALAIRELALPFVLLMAAMALWRGDRREGAAWALLALVFAVALAVHVSAINAMVRPGDGHSASWLALRGLTGWTSDLVLSSNLRFLPHWLAGPLAMLAVFGWTGWRSAAGAFGALLQLGYGLLFMLAGRPDNYYWGFMVTPALFMGLAFAPMALRGLWQAARLR